LTLQVESSITHSHDQNGKTKHVTKVNNQDPYKHGETTHQATYVGQKQLEDPGEARVPSTIKDT
jgi:hypothetical protein